MKKLRAILLGLIALSLAASPAVAAHASAAMVGMSSDGVSTDVTAEPAAGMSGAMAHAAAHNDCCHPGVPCEKPVKSDCDGSGACMAKCSVIPATIVSSTEMARPALLPLRAEPVADSLQSTRENPPFPPPRL